MYINNNLNHITVIGFVGSKSVLAKSFVKKYNKKFIFKSYKGDIRDYKEISLWLKKNIDINIFINFAAITSPTICEKLNKKALEVNYKSVVKLLVILDKIKMNNFYYFLSLSSCHVFKKSKYKLKESSQKQPSSYYGFTKLKLENYIFKNEKKFNFKIGIARIFNYYNNGLKDGFFINDVLDKLKKKKIVKFHNVNTYRDFISMEDINTALLRMLNLKLKNDYNICSGSRVYLPDIIMQLNKKYKRKLFFTNNKLNNDLVGSNSKLKAKGWKINKENFLYELVR